MLIVCYLLIGCTMGGAALSELRRPPEPFLGPRGAEPAVAFLIGLFWPAFIAVGFGWLLYCVVVGSGRLLWCAIRAVAVSFAVLWRATVGSAIGVWRVERACRRILQQRADAMPRATARRRAP